MKHNDEELIELNDGNEIEYRFLLNKLATSLFVHTSEKTLSGNMVTDFKELEDEYDLPAGFIDGSVASDVESKVYELYGEMVAEIDVSDNSFDLTLWDSFVCGYTECDACLDQDDE